MCIGVCVSVCVSVCVCVVWCVCVLDQCGIASHIDGHPKTNPLCSFQQLLPRDVHLDKVRLAVWRLLQKRGWGSQMGGMGGQVEGLRESGGRVEGGRWKG